MQSFFCLCLLLFLFFRVPFRPPSAFGALLPCPLPGRSLVSNTFFIFLKFFSTFRLVFKGLRISVYFPPPLSAVPRLSWSAQRDLISFTIFIFLRVCFFKKETIKISSEWLARKFSKQPRTRLNKGFFLKFPGIFRPPNRNEGTERGNALQKN